jgi:hypothetical protein
VEIFYALHAEEQISERKIEKIWVEETIKFPDITRRKENKYYVIKKPNGKVLKVVYVRERYIKVITAYYIVK